SYSYPTFLSTSSNAFLLIYSFHALWSGSSNIHAVSSLISFNSADNSCWSPPYDSNPPPYQTHALPHSPQFL
ncbi:unnamed protein product, partial [Brassica oleracea]